MKGKWGRLAAWSGVGLVISGLASLFGWWAVCLIAAALTVVLFTLDRMR
jgi:hypothetical protein